MFEEICAGNGYDPGRPWYTVSYTFSQPFYYISYAVSAFNALEISVDALEDPDSAKEVYLEVVATPYGYDEMVEGLRMCDAFDAEDFALVMDVVFAWVEGKLGGLRRGGIGAECGPVNSYDIRMSSYPCYAGEAATFTRLGINYLI